MKIINLNQNLPNEMIVKEELQLYNIIIEKTTKTTIILEENAKVEVHNLMLGDSEGKIKIIHKGKNSKSSIQANNLVKKKSSFVAKTIVEETASNVEAKQSIKSLMLTPTANITALPIIDIKNNDVSASHGASIGTLDEELLFYMRSRGLNCKEAKEAIIQGYIQPFLQELNQEQKKEVEAALW